MLKEVHLLTAFYAYKYTCMFCIDHGFYKCNIEVVHTEQARYSRKQNVMLMLNNVSEHESMTLFN